MEYTNSYLQLYLLYNTLTKEILFSSMPIEDFFETSFTLPESFPYTNKEQNNTQSLVSEWQRCLQLKEKETSNFNFHATTTNATPVVFNIDAVGINLPFYNNSPLVLFTIKKNPTNIHINLPDKFAINNQKDYAEFIDIASHDLDAPLRKLSFLIERFTHKYKTEPDSDMQDYFTRIQTSLTDMRSLVDSLTRFSGLNSVTGHIVSCDINIIAGEIMNDFRLQEQDKKIPAILSSLPVLQGDKLQYRQLFQNLLQNAFLYRRKDLPLEIKISGTPLSTEEKKLMELQDDKAWFKITVVDNGIGFNQEYAEKIFRPFVRLHGKSEYPGTGMGLAICKKITQNHGGIIYAEGVENKGATFTLILPQSL